MRKPATVTVVLTCALAVALLPVDSLGASVTAKKTPVELPGKVANSGSATASRGGIAVAATDLSFSPTFIKAKPGIDLHVEVTNEDTVQHTFTLKGTEIDATLDPGMIEHVYLTVPKKGALNFFCRFHGASSGMQGAIYAKKGAKVLKSLPARSGGGSESDTSHEHDS